MAVDVIGHINCPYCGYDAAEVKETKKVFQGRAIVMVWCPHPKCSSQYFPRSKDGSDSVRNRMKPVESQAPAPAAQPQVEQKPAEVKPKSTFAEFMGS